jgi:hypothetical protein
MSCWRWKLVREVSDYGLELFFEFHKLERKSDMGKATILAAGHQYVAWVRRVVPPDTIYFAEVAAIQPMLWHIPPALRQVWCTDNNDRVLPE